MKRLPTIHQLKGMLYKELEKIAPGTYYEEYACTYNGGGTLRGPHLSVLIPQKAFPIKPSRELVKKIERLVTKFVTEVTRIENRIGDTSSGSGPRYWNVSFDTARKPWGWVDPDSIPDKEARAWVRKLPPTERRAVTFLVDSAMKETPDDIRQIVETRIARQALAQFIMNERGKKVAA